MEVRLIDHHDDQALQAWHDVYVAAHRHDHPSNPITTFRHHRGLARGRGAFFEYRAWALFDGPILVGAVDENRPLADNLETVFADVAVHPEHRRRGHGRRLVEAVIEDATQAGRTRWIGELPHMPGDSDAGAAFAMALTFRPVLHTDIRSLKPPFWRPGPWLQDVERHSAGYRTMTWRGAMPEHLLEDRAALAHRMVLDAPMGDMTIEPENYNPERVRDDEELARAMGMEMWGAGAVLEDHLVAVTDMAVDNERDTAAYQWDTIVDPAHRGRRLGLLVKGANLAALSEDRPDVTEVWTHNAAANEPMIRVNEMLGFEMRGDVVEFQCDW